MSVSRGAHGSALLPCGCVMVFGGRTGPGFTASSEVFSKEGGGTPCTPIELVPLVMGCTELPGHSACGFYAKLLAAQADYDAGDIDACLEHMRVFYLHIRAFDHSGHLTDEHVDMLYEGYASVVTCLGGEPLEPIDWR
jgi:hypothetical protein